MVGELPLLITLPKERKREMGSEPGDVFHTLQSHPEHCGQGVSHTPYALWKKKWEVLKYKARQFVTYFYNS